MSSSMCLFRNVIKFRALRQILVKVAVKLNANMCSRSQANRCAQADGRDEITGAFHVYVDAPNIQTRTLTLKGI